MEMTSLRELHRNMISIRADLQQFQVRLGAASFDCLFSVRETPFILALTSRGEFPKFFKFEVKTGYSITAFFDRSLYYELLGVLKTGAETGIKLEPKRFLDQLNTSLPTTAKPDRIPTPKRIIQLRPDIVDEREKPYFDTWIYWKSEDRKGPTKENLHKTLLILGKEAHQYSLEMCASSRWSSVDLERDWKSSKKNKLITRLLLAPSEARIVGNLLQSR